MEIKQIRQRLGLTQEKLAQRLGVSCYTVRRWEAGRVRPSPLAQKAIDDLLKEERDATKV